ncbi:hypothetical protein [Alicyclobacillus acidoterrestris]|uniref:Uncharacterized protein n=1 Tax=Alicyclobacillus acidoterrestris (strain ATCC 49025 / DSM 3922 / CIP 106132 / NCIMB 13137 / GD3B) TaxID=1356854 RepID=A0A9E6ZFI8_ALIAG|nr:hypothetical protein [Alicyclobacillus acidoterrestris]UNO48062.1 hypothetical protein K1I37_15420 [Alicyclobacillus acidoterrestris]
MRYIDLATMSMTPGSGIAETKIPLWWADGTTVSNTSSGNALGDGAGLNSDSPATSNQSLFTLSSNWPLQMQFALETTVRSSSTSYTASANLIDMSNSETAISGSQVSTTSTTLTVIRSGKFNLTPGHTYGVAGSSNGGSVVFSDASLIIFPQ